MPWCQVLSFSKCQNCGHSWCQNHDFSKCQNRDYPRNQNRDSLPWCRNRDPFRRNSTFLTLLLNMSGDSRRSERSVNKPAATQGEWDPTYLSYFRWVANGRPAPIEVSDDSMDGENEGSLSEVSVISNVADNEELLSESRKRATENERKMREKLQAEVDALKKTFKKSDDDDAGPSKPSKGRKQLPKRRN